MPEGNLKKRARSDSLEQDLRNGKMQKTGEKFKNLIIYGTLGVGKSRFSNVISGDKDRFKVSKKAKGCTMEVSSFEFRAGGELWRMHDTPGLNDPNFNIVEWVH